MLKSRIHRNIETTARIPVGRIFVNDIILFTLICVHQSHWASAKTHISFTIIHLFAIYPAFIILPKHVSAVQVIWLTIYVL